MGKSALYLWCAGFALVTFDLILTLEISAFTIKCFYFFFLAAAMLWGREELKAGSLASSVKILLRPPWIFAFLLFIYELGMSPFSPVPKKSFAYSIWLLFDTVVVAIPGYHLLTKHKIFGMRALSRALLSATIFLVGVLLVDLIAFQYGYIGGLLGFNQELSLMWGMSRAHAYSFEPSYLSLYFTFIMLFFLGQLVSTNRYLSKLSLFAGGFLLLAGIFLLGSRTGWALTAIGSLALLGSAGRRLLRKDFLLGGTGVVVAVLLTLGLVPGKQISLMRKNLVGTLLRGSDGSSNTRVEAIREAARTLKESHGLGVGVGGSFFYFIAKHPEVVTPQLNTSQGSENIMSTWGQLAAESGVPGLALYFGFAFSVAVSAYRAVKKNIQSIAMSALVSSLLFFGLAAHLVGNVARTDVWVWFALWMALSLPPRKEA